MTFRQFLELKFLQWQQESGGRRTVLEFAKYIGVSQSTISTWWNGDRLPEGANVQKLAKKLGLEVYDVLNLPRPDADLHYVQQFWENLPSSMRKAMRESVEKYMGRNNKNKPSSGGRG